MVEDCGIDIRQLVKRRDCAGDFLKDGYLLIKNFYDAELIASAYSSILDRQKLVANYLSNNDLSDVFCEKSYAIEGRSIKYLKYANFWFDGLDFLINTSLLEAVASVNRVDSHIAHVELHQKSPSTSETPPHQDNFYFGLDLKKNIATTSYVALNHQTKNMGGLGFYPGTHLRTFNHHQSDVVGFSSGINSADLEGYELLTPEMAPGDLIIHHCNIVHSALENSTNETRANIAIRVFPDKPVKDIELVQKYKSFVALSKRVG